MFGDREGVARRSGSFSHLGVMTAQPTFGPLDVSEFTVGAMLRAGIAIRRTVRGAETMEDAANAIVRYLYEYCVTPAGQRACALVRFYTTHQYGSLTPSLQRFAADQLGAVSPRDDMRCLTLLATAGDEAAWNSRRHSRGHQTVPLASAEAIRAAPMILGLFEQLGIDMATLLAAPQPSARVDGRTYDVFHVEHARDSALIPAQAEFVEKYGIASVVGFGGLLRSGELFAVILFSREPIDAASAARFRTIALDVRSSLFAVDESRVWREETGASAPANGH